MTDKTGGPAFPNLAPSSSGPHIAKRDGMTLRDWFAGQALLNVPPDLLVRAVSEGAEQGVKASRSIAALAYEIADAMIAERAESGEG